MSKRSNVLGFVLPALVVAGLAAYAPEAAADTSSCAQGRCSVAEARLVLEGREPLRTSIDTGWMPSCDGGVEHCNKGLQVRANIALAAAVNGGALFKADMPKSAVVNASWEDPRFLMLDLASLPALDSLLTISHSLVPQAELYVDVGPFEQHYRFPATRLLNIAPGAKYEYNATASAPFAGWGFEGVPVTVPAPALDQSRLFSADLSKLPDVIDRVVTGSVAIHARTSPTFTFKTAKVVVAGKELSPSSQVQLPFPPGNHDYLELPASIEAQLSAKGEIEVLPSATLARLGDMNFSPPATITFSSVKVTRTFDAPPQTYAFGEKTIRIPLPNVRRPLEGLDGGQVSIGGEGPVAALMENTGEAAALVRLESSDPRFVVPSGAVTIAPKSNGALPITFRPDGEGAVEATIKAVSNDPDTPELTFTVRAEGVRGIPGAGGAGPGEPGGDADGEALGDSGCGCKTAGASTTTHGSFAGLGLAVLGLAAAVRRRRAR